jgi:hypothetical protein
VPGPVIMLPLFAVTRIRAWRQAHRHVRLDVVRVVAAPGRVDAGRARPTPARPASRSGCPGCRWRSSARSARPCARRPPIRAARETLLKRISSSRVFWVGVSSFSAARLVQRVGRLQPQLLDQFMAVVRAVWTGGATARRSACRSAWPPDRRDPVAQVDQPVDRELQPERRQNRSACARRGAASRARGEPSVATSSTSTARPRCCRTAARFLEALAHRGDVVVEPARGDAERVAGLPSSRPAQNAWACRSPASTRRTGKTHAPLLWSPRFGAPRQQHFDAWPPSRTTTTVAEGRGGRVDAAFGGGAVSVRAWDGCDRSPPKFGTTSTARTARRATSERSYER